MRKIAKSIQFKEDLAFDLARYLALRKKGSSSDVTRIFQEYGRITK